MGSLKKSVAYALVITIMVSIMQLTAVSASDSSKLEKNIGYAFQVAKWFVSGIDDKLKIGKPIVAENLQGEFEVAIFDIGNEGFIIVNLNDLSIPELNLECKNPYAGVEHPVYNGPLCYYSRIGDSIISIRDLSLLEYFKGMDIYKKEEIQDKEGYISKLFKNTTKGRSLLRVEKYINGRLEIWNNPDQCCGAVASAMCMRYYNDYVDSNYVENMYLSERELIELMRLYVGHNGTLSSDVVFGLNNYFNYRHVDNEAYYTNGFNYSLLKRCINNSRPVIVELRGHSTYKNHWVVAYGYCEIRGNASYIIVNDGWGYTNQWISIDDHVRNIVYFKK